MPDSSPPRPLSGLRVIDFSTLVAGPWCTRLLADCGAEVIKIEAAGEGDVLRHSSAFPGGVSRTFAHFNCGKRCVAIDLKTPAGVELARRLIERADVVVENFRPGVMAKLGLDYARVSVNHPRLVYCSVSGFGQDGPMSQQAAYAPIVHALSGFDFAVLRAQREVMEPLASGVMIADVVAAAYAFGAIQTALLRREREGRGAHIDATLIEAMLSLVAIQVQEAQAPAPAQPKVFRPTRTADGHAIVPLVSARNYVALYPVIGKPEWSGDPSFTSLRGIVARAAEIDSALAAWASTRKTDDVVAAVVSAGLPCSRYRAPEEVLRDEHLIARGSFAPRADAKGEYVVVNPPFRFADATLAALPSVGALGEHTREVLSEVLGLGDAKLDSLTVAGAFGAPRT